jgi:phosphoribosylformimino-5-aminoimidazole carboxamide ribotide isomerase
MEVIPVIDLKGGVVVRARHGDRGSYRPIETPLSATSEAVDVVAGLLGLHPFRTLYIADLDAIEGVGDHFDAIGRIAGRFPQLALWIDNGCGDRGTAEALLSRFPTVSLVVGSESQTDTGLAAAIRESPRALLSLDFRGDEFLGPEEFLADTSYWPDRIIVMTLASVGGNAGPDFARFQEIKLRAGPRPVFMAGGLRGGGDLAEVAARGAAGILVASALHDGRLSPADLAQVETGRAR